MFSPCGHIPIHTPITDAYEPVLPVPGPGVGGGGGVGGGVGGGGGGGDGGEGGGGEGGGLGGTVEVKNGAWNQPSPWGLGSRRGGADA